MYAALSTNESFIRYAPKLRMLRLSKPLATVLRVIAQFTSVSRPVHSISTFS